MKRRYVENVIRKDLTPLTCLTDGTEFGCEWTSKALAEAGIGEDARAKILHSNAAAMMSRLAKVAQRETVAA